MHWIIALLAFLVVAEAHEPIQSSRSFISNNIFKGNDVPPGKYPSLVSLRFDKLHYCAGTILNANWVLTAAHCIYGLQPSYMTVYTSSIYLNEGGQSRDVEKLIWHENYNIFTLENDIGLVKVSIPFIWDTNTASVFLPPQDEKTGIGSAATVLGWGIKSTGGIASRQLHEANVWTVSDDECRGSHFHAIFNSNICAYYSRHGQNQSIGDSGGPLFVDNRQVGIVSWSQYPRTVAPYPGVYTEVSAYTDWIKSHTKIATHEYAVYTAFGAMFLALFYK